MVNCPGNNNKIQFCCSDLMKPKNISIIVKKFNFEVK